MNRDTHGFAGAQTARLTGWRRVWRYTTLREVAYLTVYPDPDSAIDGLIAPVPDQDWAALDYRERAYARAAASLAPGGLLLNADLMEGAGEKPGRLPPEGHLHILRRCGLERVECTFEDGVFACCIGWAP